MISIIMAGGTGSRLWPYSRNNFPKQFLSLLSGESFIQTTAKRLSRVSGEDKVFVVAGDKYKFSIIDQLSKSFQKKYDNLILEPSGRNTTPAIALTLKYLTEKAGVGDDEILLFSPSDHLIAPEETFVKAAKIAADAAGDKIVTFGIVPRRPETGYGYIELSGEFGGALTPVKCFVEKPDVTTAESYLASGNYMWNSGMFLFSVRTILEAFRKFVPDLYEAITNLTYEQMVERYDTFPNISFDYSVMEKASNIACSKLDIDWNDIGSWESIYEALPKGDRGNAVKGNVELYDVENSLVIAQKNLTTAIGVKDLIIVETDDAVLVCNRDRAQDVRGLVDQMKASKRKEVSEHVTTYRPWGSYTVLEEGERYKIKRIEVNPGAVLSLQRHRHRSEHWVVVKGVAQAQIGDETVTVNENESCFVPMQQWHRLSNPGRIPLEMIEVQNGTYVGEDDIERKDDQYGRM